ncbi:alanine--tRNA ligase [Aliidiomarina maris]|uniref:Alanine--tRNA ligase n=1 Tax=Aliidiomarina maris TaxID=531312 RepID=A0A327XBU7_9GAMM|nr:alanine--tRNA ligase [Aliidiomarina maris]RAK01756.1 alanyl-tRNA synthetase [Aliidiomarina maris]RUO28571.1 alanine--tRNA ligase [Aliidiomarina maris]
MSMSSAEIRSAFLNFFAERGHEVVPSGSLIPHNDDTLLFTNAGMVPFKDVFLGTDKRAYQRATSSQRCVRAGGKHNDLENVGYTARHHTFFEMLGNFSFGDYFKREAIQYSWQFLTEELKLPAEKLWITVFESDDEAFDIWAQEIGVPTDRISRIGEKDNFWSMGDTGPCGPCSEIFYDHGEDVWGGPPGTPEEDGDRYIEIWNLVFMQYNRQADGSMQPLAKQSIDTGMGLERIAAIMQGVHSNYETDTFVALIAAAAQAVGCNDLKEQSLRVIADHIRSCSFLIADGVLPSNEGRGYVLRRIIRRAVRHGTKLGANGAFFYKLVDALIAQMGAAYPELVKHQQRIEQALLQEEEQFARTLQRGLGILDDALAELKGDTIDGELAFKLYDTYGFPLDLTADVARERGYKVDEAGFAAAMDAQRKRAQQASQFTTDYTKLMQSQHETEFSGYERVQEESQIVELFYEGKSVDSLAPGQSGVVVLAKTPFYAESGGQVGDTGTLSLAGEAAFNVTDTQHIGKAVGHHGEVTIGLSVGMTVLAQIDAQRREAIKANHSATHLLHAALRNILGDHVSQKGSLVDAERLRFDFAHPKAVSYRELQEIEAQVNAEIRRNSELSTALMPIEDAKAKGAMALFGEKYDDEVRVVQMGAYSLELCGGTHVNRTGDIGSLRIMQESGIASGVRRIEATTAEHAVAYTQQQQSALHKLAELTKVDQTALVSRIEQLLDKQKQQEKQLAELQSKLSQQAGASLIDQVTDVAGVKTIIAELQGTEAKALRGMVDDLKNQLGEGIVVLAAVQGEKVALIAGVTDSLTAKVKAGELINHVASQVGGKGGGRADMAQAGGTQPENVADALGSVTDWLLQKL